MASPDAKRTWRSLERALSSTGSSTVNNPRPGIPKKKRVLTVGELKAAVDFMCTEAQKKERVIAARSEKEQMHESIWKLNEEVRALREAFVTLSDVLCEETEKLQNDSERKWKEVSDQLAVHDQAIKTLRAELRKTNELEEEEMNHMKQSLSQANKAVTSHNAKIVELASVVENQNSAIKKMSTLAASTIQEQVDDLRSEFTAGQDDMRREYKAHLGSVHQEYRNHVDSVVTKVKGLQSTMDKVQEDSMTQSQQRVDDLALLQNALATVQKQASRHSAQAEEGFQTAAAQSHSIQAQVRSLESTVDSLKVDVRGAIDHSEDENRRKHESVCRAINVIADILRVPSPLVATVGRAVPDTTFSDLNSTLTSNKY